MQDVQDRAQRLMERVEEEERRAQERRHEIDERAIRLHDGRLVYTDGDNFRDEKGRVLAGSDRDEAAGRSRAGDATWREKTNVERQVDALHRLQEKVGRFQNNVSRETYDNVKPENADKTASAANAELAGYEKEFQSNMKGKGEGAVQDYGSADYSGFKTTSYAAAIDPGAAKTLRTDFAPASDGTAPDGLKTAKAPVTSAPAPGPG